MVKLFEVLCRLLASERLDSVVLWGYHLLTYLKRLPEGQRMDHLQQNRAVWKERSSRCLSLAADGKVYLEYQTGLFGGRDAAGCVFGVQRNRPDRKSVV